MSASISKTLDIPKPAPQRPVEIIRIGCEEMNLVEYPFASLWTKQAVGSIIEHQWETQHPTTGRAVKASWRVTGDPELGLPGPSDERIYLALMELSREAGFSDPVVRFTRHDLLRRLGWVHNDKNYRLLVNAFRRLGAAFVSGENAFWDASIKSFRTIGFNILDHYDIVAERPGRKKKNAEGQSELPLSYFKWADVIYSSVQAGYIRTLDVGFALSLKGDLALRLFRYLDKKAYDGRRNFEIEVALLCDRHLGMKPTPYDSTRKARLKGAHDELLDRGFLREVSFAPMKTRKGEKACYVFSPRRGGTAVGISLQTQDDMATLPTREPKHQLQQQEPRKLLDPRPLRPALPVVEQPALSFPDQTEDVGLELVARMTAIGVSPEVARALEASVPAEELALQLDCLGERKAKDEAAVFVKSVREKWAIPQAHLDRVEARERSQRAQKAREAQQHQKTAQKAARHQEEARQEQEASELDALWEQLDGPARERIDAQARFRLGVLGQAGRAPAALMAMRRNLLREGLGQEASSSATAPGKAK